MIDFRHFFQQIAFSPLAPWLETLPLIIKQWHAQQHGNCEKWANAVNFLPELRPDYTNYQTEVSANIQGALDVGEKKRIAYHLKQLRPWRKGPYFLYDIHIDCEWRSDFKWQRILPYLSPLKDRLILDVGCGNGYYMWRMLGEGAKTVVGIDPTTLFLYQFAAIKKLLNSQADIHLIPIGIEQMQPINVFDTVFSMGVLYHRKSPMGHLTQLKSVMRKGGELILETLVVDGDERTVLVPDDRYAKMKNIYFLPSVPALMNWLKKCGFDHIRCVDVSQTSLQEQRKTEWIESESLADFLNPADHNFTIEGYPAPKRATILANV